MKYKLGYIIARIESSIKILWLKIKINYYNNKKRNN